MKKKRLTDQLQTEKEEILTVLQACNHFKLTGYSRNIVTEKYLNSVKILSEWESELRKIGII